MSDDEYAQTIVDMVHQPLAVVDRELRLRFANPAFCRLFDCTVGSKVEAFIDAVEHGSFEMVHHDRVLAVDTHVTQDAIFIAIDDITQRRKTERSLRHHEHLLRAITDAVFSLDQSWRILTWNPAAEKFFGYTAAEAIGKRSEEVIHLDGTIDRGEARAKLSRGEPLINEARIRRKDGTWAEVSAATVPVRDGDNNPVGYVCIMHDIHDIKEHERQLREHARVVDEANRELDSFTYSVSHDLRAPLRAIDGFSRILEEDHGPRMSKEELRLVAVIRKNTVQMGQLIDDLLAFSRLGRKELAMSSIDMKELLIELVPVVLAGTEERVIDLKVGSVPKAVGDRSLLKQVWQNLLTNAIKYTRNRDRAVIAVSGEESGEELVYSVTDNGVGFDMQYADKLFGVFQRLHHSNEFEGTGVGLALVARVIRRHGGRVWAEGKPGEGATFRFALPRRSE